MTNEEIMEYQRKMKVFRETELGRLFNAFMNLHATAVQLDERSGWNDQSKVAKKAWAAFDPVHEEFREKLMKIAGVE